jgi:hypothetical protein
MPNLKPYRTKAQKAQARRTARKDTDGAWRSDAPFCIHGMPGVWIWDASHKVPVRTSEQAAVADELPRRDHPERRSWRRRRQI